MISFDKIIIQLFTNHHVISLNFIIMIISFINLYESIIIEMIQNFILFARSIPHSTAHYGCNYSIHYDYNYVANY